MVNIPFNSTDAQVFTAPSCPGFRRFDLLGIFQHVTGSNVLVNWTLLGSDPQKLPLPSKV